MRSLTHIFILFYFLFYRFTRKFRLSIGFTKARALKEGKQNIFGGKMGSIWLHTYERRTFYVRQRVNFPKCKGHKKEGKRKKGKG